MRRRFAPLAHLFLLVAALHASIGSAQAAESAILGPGGGVASSLTMFYHPPQDGAPIQTVAQRVGAAVLTKGDERYRDQMRAAGWRGPALQYLMANETSGPAGLRMSGDPCGAYPRYFNNAAGIAGDFCERLHADERNFLHNGRGERLYTEQSWGGTTFTLYLMNPAAPGWRAYFAEQARENLNSLGYSGLFLDNVDLSLHRAQREGLNADGVVLEYGANEPFRADVAGFLAEVRAQVGEAALWANLTSMNDAAADWEPYLPYLDGVMQEYFVARWSNSYASPAIWDLQLRQVESALDQGKALLAVSQGGQADLGRMRFALASYLLVQRDGAYFRYADGDAYEQAWLYDEYGVNLGSPLGERYEQDGLWRRDFSCGSVTVDVAGHEGTITGEPNQGCA